MSGIKYSSRKIFEGSKPQTFYDKSYFLHAKGSMYGKKNDKGDYIFFPYNKKYQMKEAKRIAEKLKLIFKIKSAMITGCARGYLVTALRELDVDAYGIDISEYAIKHADKKAKPYVFCGDICDMSLFSDKRFDIVIACDVLEHIAIPDLYKAIDECCRIGTIVFISLPVSINGDDNPNQGTEDGEVSHVSIYTDKWWIKEFNSRFFAKLFVLKYNKDQNMNAYFADILSKTKYRVKKVNNDFTLCMIGE